MEKDREEFEAKTHVILFRPAGEADIVIFKARSEELYEFVADLYANNRGFVIAGSAVECLSKVKKRKYRKRKIAPAPAKKKKKVAAPKKAATKKELKMKTK